MLSVLVALLLPPCPAGITAQPLPAEDGVFRARKSTVGGPPSAPCLDAEGHLAVPLAFAVGRDRLTPQSHAALDRLADWLHAHPNEALMIHGVYWIGWIRSAQPALRRAQRVQAYLVRRGVAQERLQAFGHDVLIPDDAPNASARRRATRGIWFERRPHAPRPETDCAAACALGRCTLVDGRCVATAESCATAPGCTAHGACHAIAGACAPRADADCAASAACASEGACRLVDGTCQAATPADCAKIPACRTEGRCTPVGGQCQRGRAADCRQGPDCAANGLCGFVDGRCEATSSADCRASAECRARGWCTLHAGRCQARTARDCRRSTGCTERGACTPSDGWCVPRSAADCRASRACRIHGLCSVVAFNCGAKTAADCAGARACTAHGRCRPGPKGDCQE